MERKDWYVLFWNAKRLSVACCLTDVFIVFVATACMAFLSPLATSRVSNIVDIFCSLMYAMSVVLLPVFAYTAYLCHVLAKGLAAKSAPKHEPSA